MAGDADVIVVGGGLAGLVAACEIADAGKRVILIDHDDAFAGIGNLRGGNEAREAAADHNYVCIACHSCHPPCFRD